MGHGFLVNVYGFTFFIIKNLLKCYHTAKEVVSALFMVDAPIPHGRGASCDIPKGTSITVSSAWRNITSSLNTELDRIKPIMSAIAQLKLKI